MSPYVWLCLCLPPSGCVSVSLRLAVSLSSSIWLCLCLLPSGCVSVSLRLDVPLLISLSPGSLVVYFITHQLMRSVSLPIDQSIHFFTHPYIHLFIHSVIYPLVHPFILFIQSVISQITDPSMHTFYASINSSNHP